MDPATAALIGSSISGGASFLGGIMQNNAASDAADKAWDRSVKAYKNRHTWEVQDLRKAGLNPILSANSAGPAPSAQAAQVPSNPIGEGVSSALQTKRLAAEIELMKEQASKVRAETAGVGAENVGKGVIASVWERLFGPASARGIGALTGFNDVQNRTMSSAGSVVKKAVGAMRDRGDHFLTDYYGRGYNYPPSLPKHGLPKGD